MFLNKPSYSNCYFLSRFGVLFSSYFRCTTAHFAVFCCVYHTRNPLHPSLSAFLVFLPLQPLNVPTMFGFHSTVLCAWIELLANNITTVDVHTSTVICSICYAYTRSQAFDSAFFRTFLQFAGAAKLIRKRKTKIKYKQTSASSKNWLNENVSKMFIHKTRECIKHVTKRPNKDKYENLDDRCTGNSTDSQMRDADTEHWTLSCSHCLSLSLLLINFIANVQNSS